MIGGGLAGLSAKEGNSDNDDECHAQAAPVPPHDDCGNGEKDNSPPLHAIELEEMGKQSQGKQDEAKLRQGDEAQKAVVEKIDKH